MHLSAESQMKWKVSLLAGVLFLILSSPFAYQLTNKLTSLAKFKTSRATGAADVCPTMPGVVLHGLIYGGIMRGLMQLKPCDGIDFSEPSPAQKNLHSLLGAVLFMFVGSPYLFKMTSGLSGLVDKSGAARVGCVTAPGLFLHAIVFALLTRAIMEIKFKKDPLH